MREFWSFWEIWRLGFLWDLGSRFRALKSSGLVLRMQDVRWKFRASRWLRCVFILFFLGGCFFFDLGFLIEEAISSLNKYQYMNVIKNSPGFLSI